MRMRGTHTPEIVDDDVEHAQQRDKKHGRIFCLKSNHNHDTCKEPNRANRDTNYIPTISFEDETKEQEDKEHPTSELKVGFIRRGRIGKLWEPGPGNFATMKRVRKDH